MRTSPLPLSLLLIAIACGPKQPSLGTSDDETTDPSTTDDPDPTTESGDPDPADTETGETSFVPETDAGRPDCDPFEQDCPEGEKCSPYSLRGSGIDGTKCVPVLGDQAPGEPCVLDSLTDATDNCDASSYCVDWGEFGGQNGTCHAFCTGTIDDPMCPAGSQCVLNSDATFALCRQFCDPVVQDCDAGLACVWAGSGFECAAVDDHPLGEPCEFVTDCAAGLVCLDAGALPSCAGPDCCAAFCELGLGDAPCEAQLPGTACVPFFEEGTSPPGYEHVGVCVVPP